MLTKLKKKRDSLAKSSNRHLLNLSSLKSLLNHPSPHKPVDKKSLTNDAGIKLQQQLVINNMLTHKLSLYREINQLLHAKHAALWLDSQIEIFKLRCPPSILSKLLSLDIKNQNLPHLGSLNMHFYSLINELLYSPLKTLSNTHVTSLNDAERQEWYNWSLQFYRNLSTIRIKIREAREFFDAKTFDKISQLTKDEATLLQLWNIKDLFQCTQPSGH